MMVKYHSIVKAFYLQKVWANDKSQILYTTRVFNCAVYPHPVPLPPSPPPKKKKQILLPTPKKVLLKVISKEGGVGSITSCTISFSEGKCDDKLENPEEVRRGRH